MYIKRGENIFMNIFFCGLQEPEIYGSLGVDVIGPMS